MDHTAIAVDRSHENQGGTALAAAKNWAAFAILMLAAGFLALASANLATKDSTELPEIPAGAATADTSVLLAVQDEGVPRKQSLKATGEVPGGQMEGFQAHLKDLVAERQWYILSQNGSGNLYSLAVPHQDAEVIRLLEIDARNTVLNREALPPPVAPETVTPDSMILASLRIREGPDDKNTQIQITVAGAAGTILAATMLALSRWSARRPRNEDTVTYHWIAAVFLSAAVLGATGTAWKLHGQESSRLLPEPPASVAADTGLLLETGKEGFNGKRKRPLSAAFKLPARERERFRQGMTALAFQRNWQILTLEESRYPEKYLIYEVALPAQDAGLLGALEKNPAEILRNHLAQPPARQPRPEGMLAGRIMVNFSKRYGTELGLGFSTAFALMIMATLFTLPAGRTGDSP